MSDHEQDHCEDCPTCHGEGVISKKPTSRSGNVSCAFCGCQDCEETKSIKIWNFKLQAYNTYQICLNCAAGT